MFSLTFPNPNSYSERIRDRPIDIQGGGGAAIFLKKIVCFPTGAKK